jgi:hypothetical protein
VRVNFILILEPSRQQSDYGLGIRQDRQPSIIAFEGFDECLRDASRPKTKRGGFERRHAPHMVLHDHDTFNFVQVRGD